MNGLMEVAAEQRASETVGILPDLSAVAQAAAGGSMEVVAEQRADSAGAAAPERPAVADGMACPDLAAVAQEAAGGYPFDGGSCCAEGRLGGRRCS